MSSLRTKRTPGRILKGFWGKGLKCRPLPQTRSPARRCKNAVTKAEAVSKKVVPSKGFTPRLSVQPLSNSRGWLHRAFLSKRYQMQHSCDLRCLLRRKMLYPAELRAHSINSSNILERFNLIESFRRRRQCYFFPLLSLSTFLLTSAERCSSEERVKSCGERFALYLQLAT
jgi:hypothetical protein